METISLKSSCLIFCASKKSCENVALMLGEVFPREFRDLNREEKKILIETLKADSGGKICETLHRTIPWGVAYHHSGMIKVFIKFILL
jgi:POLQ-like helicase